jgi:hypothetical protein
MEGLSNIRLEQSNDSSAIHFEPGTHPLTDNDIAAVYTNFTQGNLDAHGWNKEVGERIASYAYNAPALMLTIDGLEPLPHTPTRLYSSLQEAGILWTHLPARPNQLHHSGEVYVVKGDNYLRIPQTVLPDGIEPINLFKQMDAQNAADLENANNVRLEAIGEETAGIAALGLALWSASKLLSPSAMKQQMTRRRFLSNSIATAAATATAGSILRIPLPNMIADMPSEPTEEFLQTVANIVRPRITRSVFIDGRTALLLAKAEDAQTALVGEIPQMTNVVVMGDAHTDIEPTYLRDKSGRDHAIAAFAQELLSIAKQVYGSYYHVSPDQITPQATQSLLKYVSQVDVVKVTDPDGSSFQPYFPRIADKQITLYKSFNSPQVEEAISQLRPQ